MESSMQTLLEKAGNLRRYSKGEIIYRQGDMASSFCYLKRGRVKVFMTSFDGMERTLNTAVRGELLGEGAFFDKKPRVSSAVAETEAEVVMIDDKQLYRLISDNPRLAFELLEILANRIRLLSVQLDSMTFMQAEQRIARLLLESSGNDRVSLTHEEIATAVGVTRVTVSKTLARLSKTGVLATEYRSVIIKDRAALEEIAEKTSQ